MTQIVTVSPATAAYASQGGRSHARGGDPLFEQRLEHWSETARRTGDGRTFALLGLVRPPALAVAFITTAPNTAQVTIAEAERLYRENGA